MNLPMDYRRPAPRRVIAQTADPRPYSGCRLPSNRSRWFAILSISLLCSFLVPSAVAQSGKNVLFLFSAVKYSDETLSIIEPAIRARSPQQITFYHAYLDDPQVEEKSYRQSLAETLRHRYAGVKMDVVIACNPAALNFATEFRSSVFPDVPIVFVGVGELELAATEIVAWCNGCGNGFGLSANDRSCVVPSARYTGDRDCRRRDPLGQRPVSRSPL